MLDLNLLFHPDDHPKDMISIDTGKKTFSKNECLQLDSLMEEIFDVFGDKVYEAAYPSFMKAFQKH